jgi:TusA-related sulfurtransferase
VRSKLALEDLPAGARLRIVVDHEPASRNVPRSLREWGQNVLSVERRDTSETPSTWAILVEKSST